MTNEQLAYLAGIFDGEGHVHIAKKSRKRILKSGAVCIDSPFFVLETGISNTCLPLLEWCQANFDGFICKHGRNRKQCYQWRVAAEKAVRFLISIKPFIRIKATHVAIAIEFQNTRKNQRIRARNSFGQVSRQRTNSNELRKRTMFHERLKALNQGPTLWLN